jgi:hypothetical protein
MGMDMPPVDSNAIAEAIKSEKEGPAHIINQKEGKSAGAILDEMMAKEGVVFASKMEIKKVKLKDPNEEIVDREIKRNFDENDANILRNADKGGPAQMASLE